MFMTLEGIAIILLFIVAAIGIVACVYVYVRNRTLEEIRGDVYQLFIKAEHAFVKSGSGKRKMKWVVGKARGLLPEWAQVIITDELLCKVVQAWFDSVKDLLDDGKFNSSGGAHENEQ